MLASSIPDSLTSSLANHIGTLTHTHTLSGAVMATYCSVTDCVNKNPPQTKDNVLRQCTGLTSGGDAAEFTFQYHQTKTGIGIGES